MVEVVDIYGTIGELLGLPLPPQVEGRSFLPLLKNPQAHWKPAVFTQSPQMAGGRPAMGYSVATETHRLTRWVDREEPAREIAIELYDHQKDPDETRNVAMDPAYAKHRTELLALLAAHAKR
jgi:iduronate 2-sulfatase